MLRSASIVLNQGKKTFYEWLYLANEVTEIPKLGHVLEVLDFRPFLSKSLPLGVQEKAWGPWVIKSAGFYRVKVS